ncbi:hypothetical protein CesoFtcFv8_002801 [Champsocephalus esox]|uniref:Uncharacterized protein n=2 Tax=Champsocephalus TaxID=52236 RepID=A0AAN8E3J4_CHAGU|nr:hypothetical protein CesoFtcFv8_002801 [Champsocephalus esox]KAK5934471.1 hypothetical protein CgunFtcFv8_014868 [Champsocephalus gunnari]
MRSSPPVRWGRCRHVERTLTVSHLPQSVSSSSGNGKWRTDPKNEGISSVFLAFRSFDLVPRQMTTGARLLLCLKNNSVNHHC